MYLQWPPTGVREYFQIDRTVNFCRNQTNIDAKLVKDFSDGDDLDNLPNDDILKEYMLCQNVGFGLMTPTSTQIYLDVLLNYVQSIDIYYQDICFKMGKRCFSLKEKNPKELAYKMALCLKRNDPVVRVFLLKLHDLDSTNP